MVITYRGEKGSAITAAEYDASLLTLANATDLPPQAPPTGPAVITSRETLKQTGATLAYLLGDTFSPTVDASAQLNTVLPDMADDNIWITDPQGKDLLIESQVTWYSGQRLFIPNTRFRRGFSNDGVDSAMFTTGPGDTHATDIKIYGGTFDMDGLVANDQLEGHHFKFYADDSEVIGTWFLNHYQGSAAFIRGDNTVFDRVHCDTPDLNPGGDTESSAAGFRISKGRYTRIINSFARAPNDIFMMVLPITNGGDEVIEYCTIDNCVGHSYRAKLATAGASNGTAVASFTGYLRNSTFSNIRGTSGRYGIRTVADGCAIKNLIHNITWRDIDVAVDQTGNEGVEAMQITGLEDTVNGGGSIGDVIYDNVRADMTAVNTGCEIDATGARVHINGFKVNGAKLAMRVKYADLVNIRGLRLAVDSGADADAELKHGLKVDDTFTGRVVIHDQPIIEGMLSGKQGIRTQGGTVRLLQGGVFNGNAGAEAVNVGASGTFEYLDDMTGTVGTLTPGGSGTIRIIPGGGSVGTAANFTPVFADASTGGNTATGSISGTWTRNGDVVTAQIRGTDIVTTTMTAGNALYIRGLPVAIRSGNANNAVAPASMENVTFAGSPEFWGENGTTYGRILQTISGAPRTALTVAGLTSGTADIFITLKYLVD